MTISGLVSPSPLTESVSFGVVQLPEPGPRLLFDEQLPPQLVQRLTAQFPGSAHVYDLKLSGARDIAIWETAKREGFILVTKDEDFQAVNVLRGHPPKIIWVRLGNASTPATVAFFEARTEVICAFATDSEAGFLVLA